MRQFKILKWPNIVEPSPDLNQPFDLMKELRDYGRKEQVYVLNVHGMKMYFYPNEVKEVTNE